MIKCGSCTHCTACLMLSNKASPDSSAQNAPFTACCRAESKATCTTSKATQTTVSVSSPPLQKGPPAPPFNPHQPPGGDPTPAHPTPTSHPSCPRLPRVPMCLQHKVLLIDGNTQHSITLATAAASCIPRWGIEQQLGPVGHLDSSSSKQAAVQVQLGNPGLTTIGCSSRCRPAWLIMHSKGILHPVANHGQLCCFVPSCTPCITKVDE